MAKATVTKKGTKASDKKAARILEGTHIRLCSILEMGRAFDENDTHVIGGYTLRDTVSEVAKSILADLDKAKDLLPQDHPAYSRLIEADFNLSDLKIVLDHLIDDAGGPDNWGGGIESAIGRVVCVMALEAGREIERAEIALEAGTGIFGFTHPTFSLNEAGHG